MRRTPLYVVCLALLAAPVLAESVQTFIGNNTNGPTWTRPADGDPPTTLGNSGVPYSAQSFKILADSRCYIFGAQNFDGTLHLYASSFDPSFPFTNLISGGDDATLSEGTTYLPNGNSSNPATPGGKFLLSAGTYWLVTSGFNSAEFGPFQNTITCEATADNPFTGHSDPHIVQGSCGHYIGRPEEDSTCLGNRFLVEIVDVSNSTNGGIAVPVRSGSLDTSNFWFYNDTNWEVMIKVLDGCAVNGRFWVFAAALTNQAFRIVVTDTFAGGNPQKQYTNTLGHTATPVQDTNAFATCF